MSMSAWWRLLSKHGFRVSLSRIPLAFSVTASTAGNSFWGMLQSIIYKTHLGKTRIEHDPIFVLGHWRSGTTHLHELLALDDRYAFEMPASADLPAFR